MKFCLYAAHVGLQTDSFRAAFNIRSLDQLAEVKAGRSLNIPVRLVKEFSPDALAIMELGDQMDIDIAAKMYRWPTFGDETAGRPRRVYMREIDMGTDRELFDDDPTGVPLYEGRMVDQFDYRAKGYRSGRGRAADWEDLPFGSTGKSIQPQWYIPGDKVPDKCVERMGKYRIGFCDVASPTNERTLVAALLPPGNICGDKVPTITFEGDTSGWPLMLWRGVANSYAMDFIARKKVSLKMSYTVVDSLPVPRLDRDDPRTRQLVSRCLRLSCTGTEMIPFWNHLAEEDWVRPTSGAAEIPGELDDEARLQICAEVDAIVARDLFGLTRPELEYLLATFPTQQRYQEEKYGEFRSRRLILEAFQQVAAVLDESQVLRRVTPRHHERYTTCVPRLDLKVAAGDFSDDQRPEFEEWVELNASQTLRKGMFVARVIGRSMEPLIPDGAYCLFQFKAPQLRNDMVGLFQLHSAEDPECGGRFTVNRLRVSTRPDPETGLARTAVLVPDNPAFAPISVQGEDVKFVAEFLEVLRPLVADVAEDLL